MPEENKQLSAGERLKLMQKLNALPGSQFDELLFALNPPSGNDPGNEASQSSRIAALLEWIESPVGPGLPELESILWSIVSKQLGGDANQVLTYELHEGQFSEGFWGLLEVPHFGSTIPDEYIYSEGSSEAVENKSIKAAPNLDALNLIIGISEDSPSDTIATELANLCKALNAYHIACGGNGLVIDDWEILTAVRELVGV